MAQLAGLGELRDFIDENVGLAIRRGNRARSPASPSNLRFIGEPVKR